ncbi:hypothetical protein DRN87_00055 [Candidatus Geothermarchaeota archaeon]|nr:MAG: hypothetical protein DRN87_00055 [Candidatus Geothermarchaeota archaeon]
MKVYDSLVKVVKGIYSRKMLSNRLLKGNNLVIILGVLIFLFLISGGMVTSIGRQTIRTITSQSLIEFILFFIINGIYLISIYLIYMGVSKSKIDVGYITVGMVMLLITFLSEVYILVSIGAR